MGLGPLGRSFGDILFLAQSGAILTVTDFRSGSDIDASIESIKKKLSREQFDRIAWVLGKHRLSDFRTADIVLRASAVPLDSPYIKAAREKNVPTYSSAALLTKIIHEQLPESKTIGVTGTKGKSTVTAMIESVLERNSYQYHLAGNVRGVTNLPILKKIQNGDALLMELDSWQLQGFNDVKLSPKYSVFTNFFPDHMDYYTGSMKHYYRDKAAIFRYQQYPRTVVTKQTKDAITQYGRSKDLDQVITAQKKHLPNADYQVIGAHMNQNLVLSAHLCSLLGIDQQQIERGLLSFRSVEGRMQYLGKISGIHFYNDNNSTTPESTALSIISIAKHYDTKVTWWGGGTEKVADYEQLKTLFKYTKLNILFEGTASKKIIQLYPDKKFHITKNTKESLKLIAQYAQPDDVVVFSPAAASFGMFKNEYDRNDSVVKAIKKFKRV